MTFNVAQQTCAQNTKNKREYTQKLSELKPNWADTN